MNRIQFWTKEKVTCMQWWWWKWRSVDDITRRIFSICCKFTCMDHDDGSCWQHWQLQTFFVHVFFFLLQSPFVMHLYPSTHQIVNCRNFKTCINIKWLVLFPHQIHNWIQKFRFLWAQQIYNTQINWIFHLIKRRTICRTSNHSTLTITLVITIWCFGVCLVCHSQSPQ